MSPKPLPLPDDEPLPLDDDPSRDDDEPPRRFDSGPVCWLIVCLVAGAATLACRPGTVADAASIFVLVVLGIIVARLFMT